MKQRNEFASSEFNTYEFGTESVALLRPADLSSESLSLFATESAALSNTFLTSSSISQLTTIGNAIVLVDTSIAGISVVNTQGQKVVLSYSGIESTTSIDFISGFVQGVSFSATGEAEVVWLYVEGDEFHSRNNRTTVLFLSAATNNFNTHTESSSQVTFTGSGVVDTWPQINGASTAHLTGQRVSTSYGKFSGYSHTTGISQAIKNSLVNVQGNGVFTPRAQKVTLTILSSQGVAVASVVGFLVQKKDFALDSSNTSSGSFTTNSYSFIDSALVSQSLSDFLPKLSKVQNHTFNLSGLSTGLIIPGEVSFTEFLGEGHTTTLFLRGRNTLPYLDKGYEVVIRPYENRSTLWKL